MFEDEEFLSVSIACKLAVWWDKSDETNIV